MLLKEIAFVQSNNYQKIDNWDDFFYLDTGSLTKNNISELQYYKRKEDLPSRAQQKVKNGQILYSSVRPNQEHFGFVDRDFNHLLVSTGFIILTPIEEIVNPKFLYYVLTQKNITDKMQRVAQNNASSYPSVTQEDLLNIEIDLPDRKTQDKIAEILSGIDEQINRNNEIVKKLQVLIHTKYSFAFESRNVPNGHIKDICLLPSGFSFKPEMYCQNGNYKLVTIKNVNDIFVNTEKTDKISTMPNGIKKYCNLSVGDILMSLTGNVGRISIVTEKNNLLNQRVSVFKCDEKYKTYIYALLNSQKYQIIMQKISRGTSQKNLSPIDVENLAIFIPDNIEGFYNETILYFNQMILIQQNTQSLLNLKSNILPLLINNQLTNVQCFSTKKRRDCRCYLKIV